MSDQGGPERLPPQSREAERSVLGSILRDNGVMGDVLQILRTENFYSDAHQKIFQGIIALYDRGHPVDLVTLAELLREQKHLEDVGSYPYLAELWDAAPTAANAEYYARIVRDKAIIRSLIHSSTEILRDAYDASRPAEELLEGAERKILDIAQMGVSGQTVTLQDALAEAYDRIDSRTATDQMAQSGIRTGYIDLDDKTAGLQNSELIILAARPSVGKTSLALCIARNVAIDEGKPVFFVSLEMSRIELAERLLCNQARVDSHKLRKGHLSSDDMQKLIEAGDVLRKAKIFIDDSPGQGMLRIAANARRLKLRQKIALVVIDYLQLIEAENRRDSRQEQVSQISRRLKFLAKELSLPVMALAQLNRGVEDRQDHKPRLADLRESGCLAGDTLVTLAESGARVPIRDLAGRSGFPVWALDEATMKLTAATVSHAFSTGRKPVFRMTTRLGRVIRATGNHKFRTLSGWQRLDELKPDICIALPRQLPCGSLATLSDAEVALLGHLIGDGCTLPRHAIQYTTRELDLAERVAKLSQEVFEDRIEPRIRRERRWFQVYLSAAERLTHGRRNPVAAWLDGLGVFGLRSYQKFVPAPLFTQPRATIGTFLRHLWATDGCIRPPQGRTRHPAVYYATSSQRLASDVQSLLLRVGIDAVLRARSQGSKGRTQYHVLVMGQNDILRFADEIGAVGAYKTESLAACRAWLGGRPSNTNRDIIPSEIWRSLAVPAMKRNGISLRQMQRRLGMACMGTTLYRQNVSRERVGRLVSAVGGDETLRALATSDIYWDRILTIEPDGEDDVFDLTVPGPANFVANDFIAHNSIEQDADTVFLLNRPENYEPGQHEGIVEVIIGKQRNGPTGEINLTYIKQFMSYENFQMGHGFED